MLLVGQERHAAQAAIETNSAVWDPVWTLHTRGRLPESDLSYPRLPAGGWWTGGAGTQEVGIPSFQFSHRTLPDCGAAIVLVHWLLTSLCNNQLQSPDWVDLLASILRRERNLFDIVINY